MAGGETPSRAKDIALITALTVFLLYVAACLTPAIDRGPRIVESLGDVAGADFDGRYSFGLEILLFGWCGGNNGVPWSANVFLTIGWWCLVARRFRAAAVSGSVALLLGLTTWWVYRYATLVVGYYLWQGSILILLLGACWAYRVQHMRKKEEAMIRDIAGIDFASSRSSGVRARAL